MHHSTVSVGVDTCPRCSVRLSPTEVQFCVLCRRDQRPQQRDTAQVRPAVDQTDSLRRELYVLRRERDQLRRELDTAREQRNQAQRNLQRVNAELIRERDRAHARPAAGRGHRVADLLSDTDRRALDRLMRESPRQR
jgi:uncharacterized protein YlxW (UPF0749 family)